MSKRVLSYEDLQGLGIPWSRFHLARLEKTGKFPRRINLGQRTGCWLADEVEAFLASKVDERSLQAVE